MTDRPRGGFPKGFLWGAATAAYQIEGATDVDGRGPSIWDTFSATPGKVAGGDTGAVAADHYHRYHDDVALLGRSGVGMYRFSVAWSRILPMGRGVIEQRGLDFYRRLVDELLARGIEPNLTLYHWDLPQALQDAGGWPERETAHRFADYAAVVYEALHDRVAWWGTINEPWCVSLLSHAAGTHAPGERDPGRAIRAIHNVLLAHGLAVAAMRAIDPGPRQGIVLNLAPVRASTDDPDPALADGVRHIDGYRNRVWLEPLFRGRYPADIEQLAGQFGGLGVRPGDMAVIAAPIDWLGINYYHDIILSSGADRVGGQDALHPGVRDVQEARAVGDRTDGGWPITPDGLRQLLVSIGRDYPGVPPLVIAENGAAYDDPMLADGSIDDARRIDYLRRHLLATSDAINDGADVRGYMLWSLLDNFEWAEGYANRFGIVHVDFETLQRTPRRSADWYRSVIERNGLTPAEAT